MVNKLKQKFLFLAIIGFIIAGNTACSDDGNTAKYITAPLFDSLKGEWSWFKTCGGFSGSISDNEFTSTVKILSQNEDSSINYEVIVEDTLFYKGSFKYRYIYRYEQWYDTELNIKIPHEVWRYEYEHIYSNWALNFQSWESEWNGNNFETKKTKDTLMFCDAAADGYSYYYQKIK